MNNPLRVVAYLAGGGLLLTWIDPGHGILRYALLLLLILGAACVEHLLQRRRTARADPRNVVSLSAFRRQQQRRHGGHPGRERRVLKPVYHLAYFGEVNELLGILRAEGLNPVMVTQNQGERSAPTYEIRLPENELQPGRPLIESYQLQSAQHPS